MGKIEKILKKGPVEGQTTEVYPVTSTKAVYDENNKRLDNIITGLQESIYLNAPIPISTENTPESMAQNVKNIADYVEKAKAAGIADVNGMGVTCIIDGDYSGAGCLYGEDMICGITTYNDLATPYNFAVQSDGLYIDNPFIVKGTTGQVTSSMLAMGARKPIILTPDTTEVDEETYQKLLSDDVDVVFKAEGGNLCILTFKLKPSLSLVFTGLSLEGDTTDDLWFYGYEVSITNDSPHNCIINQWYNDTLSSFLGLSSFIDISTLSPVLQEIDLTGTDAERKAKLDQFETDWKALTGASDLTGARFVGRYVIDDSIASILFTYSYSLNNYVGISTNETFRIYEFILDRQGSLTITPLFSHLEAITIKTGNTPEAKAANLAAIKAYVDNLTALGVDVTKGYMIPAKLDAGNLDGFVSYHSDTVDYPWSGVFIRPGGSGKFGAINKDGLVVLIDDILVSGNIYKTLTTTSKGIIPAINEVNALAKGYSTIFTPIELTTETAQNKTTIDARVAAFTAQGISLTNGCCIPVTYKGVYAGNISLINGDWYGLLVKNTNNPADNVNIKLSADGTITEGN